METRLLKKQMTAAYQYSYVRLTLNYYTLFETISEETVVSERITAYCRRLNHLLKNHFSGNDVEEGLLDLRKDITHEVEVLTSYTDCFQIYEYVINRLERKFKTLPETGLDDENFTRRLMEFLADAEEAAVMNERIKQIISQLPVRLTKQKFFCLIMEGLSVYIGSPKENLKDMLYTLRTESMAKLPAGMDEGHKDFYETLEQFRHTDYHSMTKEGYEEASDRLILASEGLMDESGLYLMLQEIINDFCVLTFARPEAVIDGKEEAFYCSLVTEIIEKFDKEDYSPENEEFFDKLTRLEGRQEAYYERYLKTELPEESDALKADPDFIKAVNIDRLLSGSSFAELKKRSDETETVITGEETVVDRSCLEEAAGIYFKELEEVFSGASKPVVRAIMAKVLSDIPVYFNSIDEIQAYIRGSLESCLDEAEKETCKELLEELMDYENKLV
ncbi:hypothetical protein [Clostridium sp. Marseille-P2415]|uniref:hypothetical protein n=1 Tax=Clostridium sp. Marseille-P2415 TaxID=1805471 RepID=UPI00098861C7|nr:hypothetical protein [Clostridium sp. Marseille-P2415]